LPQPRVAEAQDLSLDASIAPGAVSTCRRHTYNGCWINVRDANTPAIRVEPEPRPEEARRDCVRLREERNVPVPLREDGRVGLLELPHRDLQFPQDAGEVAAFRHSGEDRVLPADHEHLPLPEPKLFE